MMCKMKYELTNEIIEYKGHTLYRIKALKDFADVKAGDIGGYVESPCNLSQKGNCWIYDDAMVYDFAHIYDAARVSDNAKVFGNAAVCDNAKVYGHAQLFNRVRVCGNASICSECK